MEPVISRQSIIATLLSAILLSAGSTSAAVARSGGAAVVRTGHGAAVVRTGYGSAAAAIYRPAAVRPWVRRPYYGMVVAGVALGTVITASAVPSRPDPSLCWYWASSAHTRGYWDHCS